MSIHSDSIYKDSMREVEAEKVDTEQLLIDGIHRMENLFHSKIIYQNILLANVGYPQTATTGSGGTTVNNTGWWISTGATSDSYGSMRLAPYYEAVMGAYPTWDRERMFKTMVQFENNTNQIAYIIMGRRWNKPVNERVGFKVVDDTLKMMTCDNTSENTQSIQTFSAGDKLNLKAKLLSDKAKFWVNGNLVGNLTSNLPSGLNNADNFFVLYLENTAAEDKRIDCSKVQFLQLEE